MIILTARQREILELMRSGEDLVLSGLRCWCGDEQTSSRLFNFLLRNVLISRDSWQESYYHINEAGERLLNGHRDIYCMADGSYVKDWHIPAEKEG